jgi:tRNA A-37 threonylcarbamoyl transferase component Bud32
MLAKTIQFSRHTVTKTGAPELMRVEVEKTRRAFQIGEECELFRVPEVLDYDEAKGVALFERLDGIEPIRNAVPWGEKYGILAEILGASLARIHGNLKLPSDMLLPLPPELALLQNEVFLHGDFSVYNVCVGKRWPPIVILDWQMTSVHGGRATFGTRYFDLMWFINNLLYRPRIRYLFGNPVASVSRQFLEAYFKTARLEYKADEIASYAKRFFDVKMPLRKQHSNLRTRFLLPFSHALTKEFIESLSEILPQ